MMLDKNFKHIQISQKYVITEVGQAKTIPHKKKTIENGNLMSELPGLESSEFPYFYTNAAIHES